MVKKLIKNGKVAVIVSPGYGAGWSSWDVGHSEEMLFDRELATVILSGGDRFAVAKRKWPDAYDGGLAEAEVRWVDKGARFYIHEYDGSESLVIIGPDYGYVA